MNYYPLGQIMQAIPATPVTIAQPRHTPPPRYQAPPTPGPFERPAWATDNVAFARQQEQLRAQAAAMVAQPRPISPPPSQTFVAAPGPSPEMIAKQRAGIQALRDRTASAPLMPTQYPPSYGPIPHGERNPASDFTPLPSGPAVGRPEMTVPPIPVPQWPHQPVNPINPPVVEQPMSPLETGPFKPPRRRPEDFVTPTPLPPSQVFISRQSPPPPLILRTPPPRGEIIPTGPLPEINIDPAVARRTAEEQAVRRSHEELTRIARERAMAEAREEAERRRRGRQRLIEERRRKAAERAEEERKRREAADKRIEDLYGETGDLNIRRNWQRDALIRRQEQARKFAERKRTLERQREKERREAEERLRREEYEKRQARIKRDAEEYAKRQKRRSLPKELDATGFYPDWEEGSLEIIRGKGIGTDGYVERLRKKFRELGKPIPKNSDLYRELQKEAQRLAKLPSISDSEVQRHNEILEDLQKAQALGLSGIEYKNILPAVALLAIFVYCLRQ